MSEMQMENAARALQTPASGLGREEMRGGKARKPQKVYRPAPEGSLFGRMWVNTELFLQVQVAPESLQGLGVGLVLVWVHQPVSAVYG